jgi:hypothetical protein
MLIQFHYASYGFIHFSHFQYTGYQLFSSPASSLGLRAFLLVVAIKICNKKCPRVVIVWHAFLPSPFGGIEGGFCHTYNIVCIRFRSSSSHASHPHSTRRWLAAQRIANHFILFVPHFISFFATVFPPHAAGAFTLHIPINVLFLY